jgi:uncharacterized protein YndB with AHSA1/START domain
MTSPITVQTVIDSPLEKVWAMWNEPGHIVNWAFASDTWEVPAAENDLRVGGRFMTRMAAKDKSASFDFTGTYTVVVPNERIEYDMDRLPEEAASRRVTVEFAETPEGVRVTETFDPESVNSEEMQRGGWQSILDNFKKYAEGRA